VEVRTIADVPTISMEEAIPVAVSDASRLAPREIYAPDTNAVKVRLKIARITSSQSLSRAFTNLVPILSLQTREEMTSDDKQKLRRKMKEKRKRKAQEKEKRQQALDR
jgi:U3 small nucleolar ribonucleoprotein component